jgi:raffinose/stachyose/melibiose transport system substrate-binding protein
VVPVQRRRVLGSTVGAVAALTLGLSSCAVGEIGSDTGGGQAETTQITFLTQNAGQAVPFGEALIEKFQAANPDIKVTMDNQPGGTEGDNLMKTKLATGEMADVFHYNSGSLFQALNPDQNLVPLTDEPWVAELSEDMKAVVSTPNGTYGAPSGSTQAGGVLYNKKVYERLGLKVPTSWSEFVANNEKIKADGKVTPILQTYGDTWTSQLFVLGDFANVAAQDPNWAAEYTANKRKYADEPALQSFINQEEMYKAGYFNKNFASAKFEAGLKEIATGTAAHYPLLTGTIATIEQNNPDNVDDVGVFPLPAQDAANTRLTIWLPNAFYIPKTTEGAELEAAKKFIAFANSPEGCEIQATVGSVSGPFAINSCKLPDDVPALVKEMEPYLEGGKSGPALEFVSPIKGPNLERITVEVGSGIRSGKEGAKLYDEDVKKQAQQLGLPGW